MKQIKNFKTITKEGFSIKNLERFYGPEWGEDSAFRADILYNNKKIAEIYQAGDGGCADARLDRNLTQDQTVEIKEHLISFLKRYDYCYQKSSPYEWLKKRTAQEVTPDEFEALVVNIEEAEETFKSALKKFKPGVNCIASIKHVAENGFSNNYLQSLFQVPDNDKRRQEHLEQVCEQLNITKERTTIHYIVDSAINLI